MKQKALRKSAPIKTAAKPLWPWFSFIFVVFGTLVFVPNLAKAAFDVSAFLKTCQEGYVGTTSNNYNCSQSSLSFDSTTAAVGSQVTATFNITDPNALAYFTSQTRTAKLFICSPSATDCSNISTYGLPIVSTPLGAGAIPVSIPFTINGPIAKNGNYKIYGDLQFINQANYPLVTYINFISTANFTVQTANNSGSPSLTLSLQKETMPDSSTVAKQFAFTYQDGGTGKKVKTYTYLCGLPSDSTNSLSQSAVSFTCNYPTVAKNYTASIQATLDDGSNVSATFQVNVTGDENKQGSSASVTGGGNRLADFINQLIGSILALIQYLVYLIFSNLIAPIIVAVLSIHAYQDSFVAVIYPGWETVRNLCNIFFIVALIIIAMATLFRVESYKARHLLVQLIIAALLINFSLVIGQAVLAVADTVQAQFLPASLGAINSLALRLMATNNSIVSAWFQSGSLSASNTTVATALNGNLFGGTIANIFWLALSVGSLAVFCAIAAFLVIRIIALWLLLMISPAAYAAGVLPSTAHYREEWWKNFLKYAFFTPIMAFFLNIAVIMANNAQNNPVLAQAAKDSGIFGINGIGNLVVSVGSNVLLLVFLIAALKVADLAGIYGAAGITDLAKKGIFAPFGAAAFGGKAAGGAIARAYTRWTTKNLEGAEYAGKKGKARAWRAAQFLNFRVVKEAYQQRVKEKEEEAYEPATGYVRDSINRLIPTEWHMEHGKLKLGQKTYYGRLGQASMIGKKRALWEKLPLSEENKNRAALDAHHIEDIEALEYVHMDGRHEDGMMIQWMIENGIDKLVQQKIREQLKAQGKSDAEIEDIVKDYGMAYYDPIEYVDLIRDRMKHAGQNDEQIAEKLSHLQEHAEGEKKQRGLGMAMNEWDNTFRAINDFSGYQKLQEQRNSEGKNGKREMLDELNKLNIFDDSKLETEGKLLYQVKDEFGDAVGAPQEITDFNSLQKVIADTGKMHSNAYDRSTYEQADLGYMLSGARGLAEYQKRMGRTSSEQAASNIEPAAYMRQFANGKFRGFSSRGRLSIQTLADAVTTSYQQTRVVQDRSAKIAGIYQDKKGGYNLSEDPKVGTIDYKTMGRLFYRNPKLASAIISRAGFNEEQLKDIQAVLLSPKYEKYLSKIPVNPTTGNPAAGNREFFIRKASDRLGATFVLEKPK